MPSVEIRCKVPLAESIILATQGEWAYPLISWRLASGTEATMELNVPSDEIQSMWNDREDRPDWWVNTRVDHLALQLVLKDVAEDTLLRLSGRHPTAETFVGNRVVRQHAEEFGRRVRDEVIAAVNSVVRVIRDSSGQYWLDNVEPDDSLQHFLNRIGAQWRVGTSPWEELCAEPFAIVMKGAVIGAADQYLTLEEWREVERALQGDSLTVVADSLLAEARTRFDARDTQLAVIHLNSALEWTVHRFLESQLAPAVPEESIRILLRQAHGRLLNEWVLPLIRQGGLNLETIEWDAIKRIQKLRAEAGHPTLGTEVAALSHGEFEHLTRLAASSIAKLLGKPAPKAPPRLYAHAAAGTA